MKENIISYVISSTLTLAVTITIFFFSSAPTSPAAIRKSLEQRIIDRLASDNAAYGKLQVEGLFCSAAQTDIGLAETAIFFGSWGPAGEEHFRNSYIALFDPAPEGLLDRLVGRRSQYRLASLTTFEEPGCDSVEVHRVEAIDLDNDGSRELHLRAKATWADGISVSPLIYKRSHSGSWDLVALPSIAELAGEIASGRRPHPVFDHPPTLTPIVAFAKDDAAAAAIVEATERAGDDTNDVADEATEGTENNTNAAADQSYEQTATNRGASLDPTGQLSVCVYQDVLLATHDRKQQKVCFLRNGGDYHVRRHPIRDHAQIAVVGQFNEGEAVLADHRLIIMFFVLQDNTLHLDTLWNWGYPMCSVSPMKASDVRWNEIAEAGIQAHIAGNTFFGYTEFQRLERGWSHECAAGGD